MANFQSWNYGGSTFDLPNDNFLALIGASEWYYPVDMASYSNASFETNTQFLEVNDPILLGNTLNSLGIPNDAAEATYYSAGYDVFETHVHTDDPRSTVPLSLPGKSFSQNGERPASAVSPGNRSLEDCLFNFKGPEPSKTDKRHRKSFSHKRRKEVRQVRRAGACMGCRIRKISVIIYA